MLLQWWQKLMRSKKIKITYSLNFYFLVVYIFKGVMEMKNKQQTENKENNKDQNNMPSAKEQYNIILKLYKGLQKISKNCIKNLKIKNPQLKLVN